MFFCVISPYRFGGFQILGYWKCVNLLFKAWSQWCTHPRVRFVLRGNPYLTYTIHIRASRASWKMERTNKMIGNSKTMMIIVKSVFNVNKWNHETLWSRWSSRRSHILRENLIYATRNKTNKYIFNWNVEIDAWGMAIAHLEAPTVAHGLTSINK